MENSRYCVQCFTHICFSVSIILSLYLWKLSDFDRKKAKLVMSLLHELRNHQKVNRFERVKDNVTEQLINYTPGHVCFRGKHGLSSKSKLQLTLLTFLNKTFPFRWSQGWKVQRAFPPWAADLWKGGCRQQLCSWPLHCRERNHWRSHGACS